MASHPPDITMLWPNHLYVYCDLAEPSITGDTCVPLLRVVPTSSNHVEFIHPHFVPVSKRVFSTAEISIKDQSGRPIPFSRGHLYVKLAFRR
jgi:hypothetical protein